jgi:hypothetical protein
MEIRMMILDHSGQMRRCQERGRRRGEGVYYTSSGQLKKEKEAGSTMTPDKMQCYSKEVYEMKKLKEYQARQIENTYAVRYVPVCWTETCWDSCCRAPSCS